MEEIRSAFLSFYEKRIRLQLLRVELSSLMSSAAEGSIVDPEKIDSSYSLVTFDVGVVESLIGDTYSLTASIPGLIETLAELRKEVRVANNKTKIFFSVVALPMSNISMTTRQYNEFMTEKCTRIIALSDQAISQLEPLLED